MVRSVQSVPNVGHGVFILRFNNIGGINRQSNVVASIVELRFPGSINSPFIGDAHMQILNVSPQDDGIVYLRVSIGWEEDLIYRVTLFIDP